MSGEEGGGDKGFSEDDEDDILGTTGDGALEEIENRAM
jgi:hypothetical protein